MHVFVYIEHKLAAAHKRANSQGLREGRVRFSIEAFSWYFYALPTRAQSLESLVKEGAICTTRKTLITISAAFRKETQDFSSNSRIYCPERARFLCTPFVAHDAVFHRQSINSSFLTAMFYRLPMHDMMETTEIIPFFLLNFDYGRTKCTMEEYEQIVPATEFTIMADICVSIEMIIEFWCLANSLDDPNHWTVSKNSERLS